MSEHIKIQGVIPHIQYVSNGILTSYDFPFAIFQTDNMEVYFNNILQAKNTYQVAFTATEPGGTVTFNAPPPQDTKITLVRNLSIERTSDFQEGGALRANTLNDELDYIIACQQQLADKLNRTMTLPVYAADGDVDFTMPNPDAGKAIVWDSTGKKLEGSTVAINDMASTLDGYKTEAQNAATTATEKANIASEKAAIATAKAQQAVETLTDKANRDLDNLSAEGKERVVSFGMPDYSAVVSKANATEYTAETNGWLEIFNTCHNNSLPTTLTIDGISHNINISNTSHLNVTYLFVPIKKGITYKIQFSNTQATSQYINFYPCIGG